ncbi:MAG: hypothetical protein LAO78_05100 [Acidobacteriia bacterium]|nr:hypothetical protein [Terriglobia bacterium]
MDWILLLGPSMIACIWPIVRQRPLTAWTERLEGKLHAGLERAEANGGKIAIYLFVPFFAGSLWMWTKTQRVRDAHIRAGLRAGAVLYLGALMCALGLLAAYLFVLAILMVLALIFALLALWAVFYVLTHEERGSAPSRSLWHGIARSHVVKGWFGDTKVVHYSRDGRKVAETRRSTDWFGDEKEVFSSHGKKIGERRRSTDFSGQTKWDEYVDGEKVGESRTTKNWEGETVEEHFGRDGSKTGESRQHTDIFGDQTKKHTWKD